MYSYVYEVTHCTMLNVRKLNIPPQSNYCLLFFCLTIAVSMQDSSAKPGWENLKLAFLIKNVVCLV